MNTAYLAAERLVAITDRLMMTAYAPSAAAGGKSYSERISSVVRTLLQTSELDKQQRVKVVDFLCHCVLEYKAIGVNRLKALADSKAKGVDLRPESHGAAKSPAAFSKSFYNFSDIAKDWGDLSHHREKVDLIKEQKIFESRTGSPIQIKGGLKFANNPPPSREYLASGQGNSSKAGKKPIRFGRGKPEEPSLTQRSRTPMAATKKPPARLDQPEISELQNRIQHLETTVASLRQEGVANIGKIRSLELANVKLQSALEDSVRVCKEYAAENELLRAKLPIQSQPIPVIEEQKVAVMSPAPVPPPRDFDEEREQLHPEIKVISPSPASAAQNVKTTKKSSTGKNSSMSEMLEFVGSISARRKSRSRERKPQTQKLGNGSGVSMKNVGRELDKAISQVKIRDDPSTNDREGSMRVVINYE